MAEQEHSKKIQLTPSTAADPDPQGEITHLLAAWQQGDREAGEALMPLIVDDLRRLAASFLTKERTDHTLGPTALVNEVYLRLVHQNSLNWQNREHFFALAAKTMRRILIDHARRHGNLKRGGNFNKISLQDADQVANRKAPDLLALDDALNSLAIFDQRKASIVEMRYFVGLNIREIAQILDCSPATVNRQWTAAKAWLFRELNQQQDAGSPPPNLETQ